MLLDIEKEYERLRASQRMRKPITSQPEVLLAETIRNFLDQNPGELDQSSVGKASNESINITEHPNAEEEMVRIEEQHELSDNSLGYMVHVSTKVAEGYRTRVQAKAPDLSFNIIEQLNGAEELAKIEAQRKLPEFSPGDTVRVLMKVTEGNRTRIQAYEGVCIARSGGGINESFTVRKISYGEGVERVFPVYSPMLEGVEVVRRGKIRRAKLHYLRERRGRREKNVEEQLPGRDQGYQGKDTFGEKELSNKTDEKSMQDLEK